MLSGLVDTLHAARLVRRQPGFAAAAILALATGIGVATAVFTLVNAVVLVDMLFATSPGDPGVCALVAGTMLGVTAVATWLPARRPAGADAAVLLRI